MEAEEELFFASLELEACEDEVGFGGAAAEEEDEELFLASLELDGLAGADELELDAWDEVVGFGGTAMEDEDEELDDFPGPAADFEEDELLPVELEVLTCEDDEVVVAGCAPPYEDEVGNLLPIDTLVLTDVEVCVTSTTEEAGPLVEVRVIVFRTVL